MIDDKTLAKMLNITIVDENATNKSINDKDAFCLTRRNGIGGSESAVILGVSKFKTLEELIQEKLSTEVTSKERQVGQLASVRKGADIEPIILDKFSVWANKEIFKPQAMFRLNNCKALTINFDGLYFDEMSKQLIPVEAKLITQYGQKYWKRDKTSKGIDTVHNHPLYAGHDIKDHILTISDMYGVPEYYYTQVQQQLIATQSDYAWLVALFDKDWELGVYKIYADGYVQEELIKEATYVWESIQEIKNNV